ncbi:MAG TPA: sigma-70 family RNA polymerase sigma factor [Acidimicrobiales bacterium]|nr:sigma-70 family RNA polymerase sigma factor [Acidimicrobiales bacterium]
MTIGLPFPEVLRAARSGADWAWERLVASIAAPLRGYVAAQGAVDPDELVGQVLLQLVQGIERFEGDEAGFRSWVFVIAHHRVIDERRRQRRQTALQARQAPAADAPPADAGLDASATIDWPQRLRVLSEDQRHVILLRVVAGLSAEEVARILGKRVGTIRVLQHRGLARLRAELGAGVTR